MFSLSYMFAELRRRKGRTILTALGLAVGVGLVVTVNALSTGLDNAQARVLAPLTGVGTDMSVTRPLKITAQSSPQQRRLNGGGPPGLDFGKLKPGATVDKDTFTAAGNQTFSDARVSAIAKLTGVSAAAGSLTLTDVHITGKVPKIRPGQQTGPSTQSGGGQDGSGGPSTNGSFGNSSIKFDARTVTGVDSSQPALAAITPSQIVKGSYFTAAGGAYQAIVSSGYAKGQNLHVGSTLTLGGKTFTVVGIASAPLGGTASDAYVKLATLQQLADLAGQVNTVQVRATDTSAVTPVSQAITAGFKGASVTTAADLAARVGGSLKDARDLSSKLGGALELVGLAAAILIASLLTLASVSKRVREIGTLKALGWSQSSVVRQISGESLFQGVLGGIIGAAVGIAGAAAINAYGWTLKATVANPASAVSNAVPGGPPNGGGPFGLGQATSSSADSTLVKITTSADLQLILLAIGLAVLGGLIAGAVGGLRAARMRPAAALRTIE